MSGNFGELRSTHFHAGIDLKTMGETGKNVYAISSGYVSRVKVQTGGYGHSLYITHFNGFTSVYAHLDSFAPEIENYLRDKQYALKKFEVDLYPDKSQFVVKSGQKIGVSGNTGSSGGPHLHLEIRDKNQVPLNALKYPFAISDTIEPVFTNLVVYNSVNRLTFEPAEKTITPVVGGKGKYLVPNPVRVSGNAGFGVEIYDFLNGSQNKCGIYTLDFEIDNMTIFSIKLDKLSFDEAPYIKTFTDYAEKILNNRSIHRMFVEPNNKLSIYTSIFNNGLYSFNDTLEHKARVVATDVHGNLSELTFIIVGNVEDCLFIERPDNAFYMYWDRDNTFSEENIVYKVPIGALYADKAMVFSQGASEFGMLGNIYRLGNEFVPMHKNPELSIKISDSVFIANPKKLVVVRIDNSGKIISEGGRFENHWVTAKVKGFGNYSVMSDTLPPLIKPVAYRKNSWYANGGQLSFKISDDLSGIKTYNGYIDNMWVLFEYDAKTESLFYRFDEKRLRKTGTLRNLKLVVTDERDNSSTFTGQFYY
ncbi:MAG: M23 family metallopeptidase [Bacteroidales bacterium]|nr:M23 family metallopeptidase [Bacteroidales bacterium]